MAEFDQLREILSMGGDSAAMLLVYLLWKLERRVHNVELHTGLKKLTAGVN